mmetsp:Transcript_7166/g.8922  ORF Transcript_7166/g.8922 Transcript_7166/m.8922 type:complete len:219 (-) Transcript_7166:110-766(-)
MSSINVIEDELPHEFYSRLTSVSLFASITGETNSATHSISMQQVLHRPPTDTHVVIECTKEDVKDAKINRNRKRNLNNNDQSSFSNVYQRAISDPNPTLCSEISLDKSNKGFAMLSRMGWKEESGGLGKRRQGTMTPVKTMLKSDRKGLGSGKPNEWKISHRPPINVRDKVLANKGRKRSAQELAAKEKSRTKMARMLLRTDVSEEFESLFWGLHRNR